MTFQKSSPRPQAPPDTANHRLTKEEENQVFLECTRSILEVDDFETTARKIFDACCRLTGAQSGYVALLSDDGSENEVLFLEAGGLPCSVDPELPMPIRGLRAVAYEQGDVVYDNNFLDSHWMEFLPAGHVDLHNVLFSPLVIGNQTVGIMGLANKPEPFTSRDVDNARNFGELAAIALKNSRSREALQKSEVRYRTLTENMVEVLLMIDLKTNDWTYISPSIVYLTGWSTEAIRKMGRSAFFDKTLAPETISKIHHHLSKIRQGLQERFALEFSLIDKEQRRRWIQGSWYAIRKDNEPVRQVTALLLDQTAHKVLAEERERLISELQQALAEVETLQGIIPICMHCKKIRDDTGFWAEVERYIAQRSAASFSHGICPACVEKYYPEDADGD